MNLGIARGLFHIRAAGPIAPIGDVVKNCIIEQHRVLRHHTDCVLQTALRHIAHVLIVDAERPTRNIVKPK